MKYTCTIVNYTHNVPVLAESNLLITIMMCCYEYRIYKCKFTQELK